MLRSHRLTFSAKRCHRIQPRFHCRSQKQRQMNMSKSSHESFTIRPEKHWRAYFIRHPHHFKPIHKNHIQRKEQTLFSLSSPSQFDYDLVGQQKQNRTSCRLIYAAIFSILILAFRLPAGFRKSHLFEFNAQLSVLRAVLLCSLFIFAPFSFARLLSDCSRGFQNAHETLKIHTHSAHFFPH